MPNTSHNRDHRYSLKTLQALYDGSTSGRISARGTLRLTIKDITASHTFDADVLSVSGVTLSIREDNGAVRSDIKPAWVRYAEVI